MSLARHRVGVVGLLALGLALGGCGSADIKAKPAVPQGADPVAWVGSFCGGLGNVIAGESAIPKSPPNPQAQKDGLLKFADVTQQAFSDTAHKLTQLGQPGITDGQKVQDTAVGFFTTAAATVGNQRAKLAALDAKDPNFVQKANSLAVPDLGPDATQIQGLTSNKDLAPAFGKAPECLRLGATATH
ncbi:MAG TPA: hypothetical protein VHY21_16965 [Pseudonocardiaceae bacterium]|nr:hypothetical protein [Pseudonocardiaceae bacterium]